MLRKMMNYCLVLGEKAYYDLSLSVSFSLVCSSSIKEVIRTEKAKGLSTFFSLSLSLSLGRFSLCQTHTQTLCDGRPPFILIA